MFQQSWKWDRAENPWKMIFWLEPALIPFMHGWIQGVCPPQELEPHATTQSWRFKSEESLNEEEHPWRQVKSLMCGHQKARGTSILLLLCQSHPDGDYENEACCAPTASGALFEGCNVSFQSYSRVWISMEPLSWYERIFGSCFY